MQITQWFLVAAVGSLLLWGLLLALLRAVTRSGDPVPASETMELAGDEPPAVVALIANGWDLPHAAAAATLLDLAARGHLSIERVAFEEYAVRLARDPGAERLTPYDELVLGRVRSVAVNGIVPCPALAQSSSVQAGLWWRRFRTAVIRDARERGLSRQRWTHRIWVLIGTTTVVPTVFASLAWASVIEKSSNNNNRLGAFLVAPLIVWTALMTFARRLDGERSTESGLLVAGRWLGVRRYLEMGNLADAPPSAVALWERYLPFGAAFGLAASAISALPMTPSSDREVWSTVSERWRKVRIVYPRPFPLGWGRSPLHAIGRGVVQVVVASLFASVFGRLVIAVGIHSDQSFVRFAITFIAAVVVVALVVGLCGLIVMLSGLADVFATRAMSGRILRIRTGEKTWQMAVDDGTKERIRALVVANPPRAREGDQVDVVVTPRLGWVKSLSVRRKAEDRSGESAGA